MYLKLIIQFQECDYRSERAPRIRLHDLDYRSIRTVMHMLFPESEVDAPPPPPSATTTRPCYRENREWHL